MNKYAQMADRLYDLNEQLERLEKENAELKEVHESDKRSLRLIAEKGANLEKKISILLSCKNCPKNKGGYICENEYEGKCLSQKIQYIKELQEENAELKDYRLATLAEQQTEMSKYALNLEHKLSWYDDQLTEAKDHIKKLLGCLRQDTNDPETNYYVCKYMTEAEQFLKECE